MHLGPGVIHDGAQQSCTRNSLYGTCCTRNVPREDLKISFRHFQEVARFFQKSKEWNWEENLIFLMLSNMVTNLGVVSKKRHMTWLICNSDTTFLLCSFAPFWPFLPSGLKSVCSQFEKWMEVFQSFVTFSGGFAVNILYQFFMFSYYTSNTHAC